MNVLAQNISRGRDVKWDVGVKKPLVIMEVYVKKETSDQRVGVMDTTDHFVK